jgi:hypothetical protein
MELTQLANDIQDKHPIWYSFTQVCFNKKCVIGCLFKFVRNLSLLRGEV